MALCQRRNRLGYWRKIRGYTQAEVARLVKVTPQTISNWELDITEPTREQAEVLSRFFGVHIRELFPFVAF